MNIEETKQMLAMLQSVFPKLVTNEATPKVWQMVFADVTPEEASSACQKYLSRHSEMPKPADVRQLVIKKPMLDTPEVTPVMREYATLLKDWHNDPFNSKTGSKRLPRDMRPIDAWRETLKYVSQNKKEQFKRQAPPAVIGALMAIGGWEVLAKAYNLTQIKADFLREYEKETTAFF